MFVLAASAAGWRNAGALESNPAGAFDFRALQLKILNPDNNQMIGSTRFAVSRDGSGEEVKGESTYLDGERDNESELLYVASPGSAPRLSTAPACSNTIASPMPVLPLVCPGAAAS